MVAKMRVKVHPRTWMTDYVLGLDQERFQAGTFKMKEDFNSLFTVQNQNIILGDNCRFAVCVKKRMAPP